MITSAVNSTKQDGKKSFFVSKKSLKKNSFNLYSSLTSTYDKKSAYLSLILKSEFEYDIFFIMYWVITPV